MAGLRICLFGTFRVWRNGEPIEDSDWDRRKTRQLLKLLVARSGRVFSRDELVEALWPDSPPDAAQASLRVTVSLLRKALEPDLARGSDSRYVVTKHSGYAFDAAGDLWVDAWECERLEAEAGEALRSGRLPEAARAFERAAALADEPYLADDPYEAWADEPRRHWQERLLSILAGFAECRARQGSYDRAIDICRRGLELDACREDLVRQLMTYQYCSGLQASALKTYRRYRQVVAEELDMPPSADLVRLATQIEAREVPGVDTLRRYPALERRPKLPYSLGRTEFVGRSDELAWLADQLSLARAGIGRAVVVEGAAGVGKSRLVEEFLGYARGQGVHVLTARCFDSDAGVPLEPVTSALREFLSGEGLPAVHDERETPPATGADGSARALAAAFLRRARASSDEAVLLFVDDLQWADPATLEFLSHSAHRAKGAPILLVATHRREASHELAPWFDHLLERRAVVLRSLAPLSLPEAAAFTERLSSRDFVEVDVLAAFLHREAEGNPLYLIEYLRLLIESRALATDRRGRIVGLVRDRLRPGMLPSGVRSVLRARLHGVDAEGRDLLNLAAVVGRDFALAQLAHATGWPESRISSLLDELVARGLVEPTDERFRFSHAKLRDATYEDVPAAERESLHLRVAAVLRASGAESAEVAHHFLRAHAWSEALTCLERAATDAEAVQAWGSALAYGDRALEVLARLPPDEPRRFDGLARRDRLLERLGHTAERADVVREMLAVATALGDEARRGEALLRSIGVHEPNEAAAAAVRHFRRHEDSAGEARAQRALGHALWSGGDYGGALAANLRSLKLHGALENVEGEAGDVANVAQLYLDLNRLDEAASWAEEAYRLYRALRNEHGMGFVTWHIATVHRRRGDLEAALHWTLEGLQHHRTDGSKYFMAVKHNQAGTLHLAMGAPEEALGHFESARRMSDEAGSTLEEGNALVGIGGTRERLGDPSGAADAYEKAVDLFDLTPERIGGSAVPLARADARSLLAKVLHRSLDRRVEARRAYDDAVRGLRPVGDVPRLAKLLLGLGGLLWRTGEFEASRAAYEEAAELARAADRAGDEAAAMASLSVVYRELGDPAASVRVGRAAVRRLQALGDVAAEGYVVRSVARSYERLGREARALSLLVRSLRLREATAQADDDAGLVQEVVRIYRSVGREDRAAAFLEGATGDRRAARPDRRSIGKEEGTHAKVPAVSDGR